MLAELCKSLPADSHCACFRQRVTLIGVKAEAVMALVELVYCGFAPLDQEEDQEIPPMTLQPPLE